MVGVAQLVRAPDCGSGGRGFDSHHSPHVEVRSRRSEFDFTLHNQIMGCSQVGKAPDFDSGIS